MRNFACRPGSPTLPNVMATPLRKPLSDMPVMGRMPWLVLLIMLLFPVEVPRLITSPSPHPAR